MKRWMTFGAPRHHWAYNTYVGMLRRCYSRKDRQYPNYGGRGIYVADEWLPPHGFATFVKDIGPKPSMETYPSGRPKWTLDRRDNDGPYCKWNLYWANQSQQCLNRRDWEWLPKSGFKLIPGRVQILHPSPFNGDRYHESSYQVKYQEGSAWTYQVLCNSHLGQLRGEHPEVVPTGYSFPKGMCLRCREEESTKD